MPPKRNNLLDPSAIIAAAGVGMKVKAPPTGNMEADMNALASRGPIEGQPGVVFEREEESIGQKSDSSIDNSGTSMQTIQPEGLAPQAPRVNLIPKLPTSDDAKVGKAFKLARNVYKKFKLKTIVEFLDFVEEVSKDI